MKDKTTKRKTPSRTEGGKKKPQRETRPDAVNDAALEDVIGGLTDDEKWGGGGSSGGGGSGGGYVVQ